MVDIENDALLREIDDELRHDRLAGLWRTHGRHLIAAAVGVVLAVAAFQGWRAWDNQQRAELGRRFVEAERLARTQGGAAATEAAQAFSRLAAEKGGYGLLARFREAGLLAGKGDPAGAAAVYRDLAATTSDPIYRDLAALLAVYQEMETAPPEELGAKLGPLTADTNPWRHLARELSALLALRRGEKDKAREILTGLASDAQAPRGLQGRAAELLETLR